MNNAPTDGVNFTGGPLEIMSKLSNVRTRYRGATIFDGDPLDLVQVYGRFSQWFPVQGQANRTDNHVRSISFPLLFGRFPYDPMECFPATRRGDLVLELTTVADPTGLDGYDLQNETIELLDAVPERFMKVTTAGREESHPHDVTITKEAPNYQRGG